MSRLFRKTAKVIVVQQPTGFIGASPDFFETVGNAIEITALRIAFSVSKSLAKEPNKCEIILTNLADHTRSLLDTKPLQVTLLAGYDGHNRLLFKGDLRHSISRVEGTEIVTRLQVADGMRAFRHARMNRSYKPPIRVSQVLKDAASSLGLDLPPELERSQDLKTALALGISMHGPTRDVLSRLLAPYGYGWSIQNGSLTILKDGEVREGEALLINEGTGLVGSPERSVPEKPKDRASVTFETLLYPEITPGNRVKLESRFINGVFRAKEVSAEGDTHEDSDSWKTSVKAEP